MKNYKKIFGLMDFHTKLWLAQSLWIRFNKVKGLLRVYNGTKYLILLALKNKML